MRVVKVADFGLYLYKRHLITIEKEETHLL